jgi:glutathione S-transferase
MKLFYAPGTCAMAAHIALREAKLPFTLEKVELGMTPKTADGRDLREVNPKGSVPALQLDDGAFLTEAAVILQFIADQVPASGLAPAAGTLPRYRLMEMLNFLGTDLHKAAFYPLFNPITPDDYKPIARANLEKRLDYLEARIGDSGFLLGPTFTVADAYAFVMLNWTNFLGIDLGKWPKLKAFASRVAGRPSVQDTLKAEGLRA